LRILHFETIGSTQDYVKDLAAKGELIPCWVRADSQNSGRGRRGREWVSRKGNLYASGLYPWTASERLKPLVSFVVAVALAETLESYISSDLIALKWPNDVLVKGAKIAGILLEAGEGWLTIGVGLNLEHHPEVTPYPVTHLLEHVDPEQLDVAEPIYAGADPILAQLAQKIETGIHTLQTEGFASIREKWLSRAARQGEVIKVNLGQEMVEGVFETLSENGALQLRLSNGTLRDIVAGDVLLSAIPNEQ